MWYLGGFFFFLEKRNSVRRHVSYVLHTRKHCIQISLKVGAVSKKEWDLAEWCSEGVAVYVNCLTVYIISPGPCYRRKLYNSRFSQLVNPEFRSVRIIGHFPLGYSLVQVVNARRKRNISISLVARSFKRMPRKEKADSFIIPRKMYYMCLGCSLRRRS